MVPRSRRAVSGPINQLFRAGSAVGLSDGQLLERFVLGHDEGAESAFNVLVERHGPMVLAVCLRVLNDPHDAQDAFQATFLVLVRKAATVRKRESIADWLHGVARRVSARARADFARCRSAERRKVTGSLIAYQPSPPGIDARDEVEHLPEDLRAAVVLCYLEGLTHEQAARRLGWPVGTVRSRLARARARLRADLTRRGIAPDAASLPMLAFRRISLPDGLIDATVRAAMLLAARDAGEAGLVSAAAVALTEGVLRTMFVSKLTVTAVILLAVAAITSGAALYARQGIESGAAQGLPVTPQAKVDNGRLNSDELDAYAARVEHLVQRARQEQAAGDWDGAIRELRKSAEVAGEWQEALLNRRKREKDDPRRSPKPVAESRPRLSGSNSPGSAERRLDDLERKVDRILHALEKGGRDRTERPEPEPIEQHPEKPGEASGKPARSGEERGTRDDEPLTGDLARIQGTWKADTGGPKDLQFVETFKRDTGAFENTAPDGRKFGATFRFEIDEKAEPCRRIHFYDMRRNGGNGSEARQVHGIYTFIDDNTILFCNRFDGTYPKGFDYGERVFTLKREPEVQRAEK
jgi:RNA polymerase sigma factor (sigma-70 family)